MEAQGGKCAGESSLEGVMIITGFVHHCVMFLLQYTKPDSLEESRFPAYEENGFQQPV